MSFDTPSLGASPFIDYLDADLIAACNLEREGRSHNTNKRFTPCLELLRRAFVHWNPEATSTAQAFYAREFTAWVVNNPHYEAFCDRFPHLTPDDVIQDVNVKLHFALRNADDFYVRFQTIGYFFAYCRKTITNHMCDYLRGKDRLANSLDDPANKTPKALTDDAEYETTIDGTNALRYIRAVLSDENWLTFLYKVEGVVLTEEHRKFGLNDAALRRRWRNVRARLARDADLRRLLGKGEPTRPKVGNKKTNSIEMRPTPDITFSL